MDGGRIVFMNIHFRLYDEYLYFKQLIEHKSIIIKETIGEQGFIVYIKQISNDELIRYFIQIYMMYRLQPNIMKIIRQDYYFTNETEVDRIVEWTNWLLHEQTFIQEHFNVVSLSNYLLQSLLNQVRHIPFPQGTISFDSFVLFQLKTFQKQLSYIVGYAIDEMKREEEYQHFVQVVRSYITNGLPKCSTVHILQDEPFQIYSHSGQKYTTEKLLELMRKEPLYLLGLDEYEQNLSPILTLLPHQIFIYGHNPDDGKTLTLLNIYQERARFLSNGMFPFTFD